MKQKFAKVAAVAGLGAVTLLPFMALAAAPVAPTVIRNITQARGVICTLVNTLFWFLIVVAIVFAMIAAFGYLTAGGDPEKVKAASHKLTYALVAVAVGVVAKGVPFIAATFLGATVAGC